MSKHRRAIQVIAGTFALDNVLGLVFAHQMHLPWWHGLYCALADAVTVGGDVNPAGWAYLTKYMICLLVVPLFAATFSIFTSNLTQTHVENAAADIKGHVTARLRKHLGTPDNEV